MLYVRQPILMTTLDKAQAADLLERLSLEALSTCELSEDQGDSWTPLCGKLNRAQKSLSESHCHNRLHRRLSLSSLL